MRRILIAVLLCTVSLLTRADDEPRPGPIAAYLHKSKNALSSWASIVTIEHKRFTADPLQPDFDAALHAANSEPQSKALLKHWKYFRRCVSDLGEGYEKLHPNYGRDVQHCADELDKRAAAVIEAANAPPR